jgi:thioredoxin 1
LTTTSIRREIFNIQDEDDFKSRVLESSTPTIVDFSAGWCGPCKLLTPRLEAAITATNGSVNLAIVDIDELGDLALDHDVQAVPTVVAIKDGKIVDKFIGLVDEDKLDAFVTKLHT